MKRCVSWFADGGDEEGKAETGMRGSAYPRCFILPRFGGIIPHLRQVLLENGLLPRSDLPDKVDDYGATLAEHLLRSRSSPGVGRRMLRNRSPRWCTDVDVAEDLLELARVRIPNPPPRKLSTLALTL